MNTYLYAQYVTSGLTVYFALAVHRALQPRYDKHSGPSPNVRLPVAARKGLTNSTAWLVVAMRPPTEMSVRISAKVTKRLRPN